MSAVLLRVTLPCLGENVPLPSEMAFLKTPLQPLIYAYEPWVEMQMPPGNWGSNGVGKMVRGKHWQYKIIVPGGKDPALLWPLIKPVFLNNGWTVVKEWRSGWFLWMHYQKDGVEAWGTLSYSDYERAWVEIVEPAPQPVTLTLAAPGAKPEVIGVAKGDFPYLGPIPGSTFRSGAAEAAPYYVTVKGASVAEVVAPGSIVKSYRFDGMSNSLFRIVYHDALTKAGWTIVDERVGSDLIMSAHYAQNGRNIWSTLHWNSDGYDIRVADAGAVTKDLGSDLAKNCHVAIYGVLFDFNKSTLQAASDPVLQQILSLLTKDAALKLEIQGHTDDVGNDAYNQTLSEARASAVVAWLTQHGVAAGQLSAKGYGKTVPIADNNTDAGRAKNRRVEIADPRCAAKAK